MNREMVESTAAPPHRPCVELERQSQDLDDAAVHRFILGQDNRPRQLNPGEAADELGDRFAELLLRQDIFPRTAGAVLTELEQAVSAGDPLKVQQFFLVGEGTQIPPLPGVVVNRNLRFLATCGQGPGGPDIMISAFHPDQGTVEVMAWDLRAGGFNYYRTVGESSAWVFAGNSRHALTPPTRDNGPFESHKSGHFLMKEVFLPWIHWDSPKARIGVTILAAENLFGHPWATRLAPGGAYTLEEDVAIPSIRRWTEARLDSLAAGTSEETPRRIVEQLVTTLTVNLESSDTSSAVAVAGGIDDVDLPDTFFVDASGLSGVLGLERPQQPFVSSAIYAQSLQTFEVTLDDDAQFTGPGDTHFAFVVPERAFEDTETVRQAVERGIVSRRLAACLLMVDFPTPVFSERRAQLLDHVPDTRFGATADFSQDVADAILGSAAAAQLGTPEQEFADRWNVGEQFEQPFNALLQGYFDAFTARLSTQEGFDDYVRLAESRRERVGEMPIAESPLLFARTNVPPANRVMRTNGTVEEV